MIGREFRTLVLLIGLSEITLELFDVAFPLKVQEEEDGGGISGTEGIPLLVLLLFTDERIVENDRELPTADDDDDDDVDVDDDKDKAATCFPTLVFDVDKSVEIFATVAFARLKVSLR